jgi:hypothetical protein
MATEPDKTNNGVLGTIVAVGVFAMIAVSAAVTAMVRSEVSTAHTIDGTVADLRTVRELKASQRAELSAGPKWVDKGKGLVAIPIDQAMDLVVDDISKNPNRATSSPPEVEQADAGVDPEGKSKTKGSNETAVKKAEGSEGKAAPELKHESSTEGRTL